MANSFGARQLLEVGGESYRIFRLDAVGGQFETLPYTLKILLENLLRHEDGENITAAVSADALVMEDGEVLYVAFVARDPDVSAIRPYRSRTSVTTPSDASPAVSRTGAMMVFSLLVCPALSFPVCAHAGCAAGGGSAPAIGANRPLALR